MIPVKANLSKDRDGKLRVLHIAELPLIKIVRLFYELIVKISQLSYLKGRWGMNKKPMFL